MRICDKCKVDTPFHLLHRITLNVVDDDGFVIQHNGINVKVEKEWCESCLGWGSGAKKVHDCAIINKKRGNND